MHNFIFQKPIKILPQKVSQNDAQKVAQNVAQNVTQNVSQNVTQNVTQEMTETRLKVNDSLGPFCPFCFVSKIWSEG